MNNARRLVVEPELVDWLIKLVNDYGSARRVAKAAGIKSADTINRVIRLEGRLSDPNARLLVRAFGADGHMSIDRLRKLAHIPESEYQMRPEDLDSDPSQATDDEVLLRSKIEIGRRLDEIRRDHPDDAQFELFHRSVLNNLDDMDAVSRLERARSHDERGGRTGG